MIWSILIIIVSLCFDDEPMFLDKLFENEFNHIHAKIIVKESKILSNSIARVVSKHKVPFGKRSLDLSILTFEDPPIDQSFDVHENDQSLELFKDKFLCFDESIRDASVIHKPPMGMVDLWFEVNCEDKFKFCGDHVEDTSIELFEDEILRIKRRDKHKKKLMRTKSKMERMKAKLTKKLSSVKSPLERTQGESGEHSRGRNR